MTLWNDTDDDDDDDDGDTDDDDDDDDDDDHDEEDMISSNLHEVSNMTHPRASSPQTGR